jgi:penicillin amidase
MSAHRITYDARGTPGILAEDTPAGFYGLGVLHARHRPLQTLLLTIAARGQLAKTLVPRDELVELDKLVLRHDIPAIGAAEVKLVPGESLRLVDAYVAGMRDTLASRGMPFELRLLGARVSPPDRESVLSSILVSACLGLAQAQERMERAIVDALCAGADAQVLSAMFAPHLAGFDPVILRRVLPHGQIAPHVRGIAQTVGGSNAWAVSGARSASGKPMLAGDPHLQANQLPALMFEIRARVGEQIWLGATIPGLPTIAVGRNRHVAWSGTFGVADNVDHWVEHITGGVVQNDGVAPQRKTLEIGRRFRATVRDSIHVSSRGVLAWDGVSDGVTLASRWAATEGVAATLDAFLRLPQARSAAEAEAALTHAQTLSLHFVLADTGGDVRYLQLGRIPERSEGWSGLYPTTSARWTGAYTSPRMPRASGLTLEATANEDRLAPDGATLSTLAQPQYRRSRILEMLEARPRHDIASMQAIQQDLLSGQARALTEQLVASLPEGHVRDALKDWDFRYDVDSRGAHAFEMARGAALLGLAPELGGPWLAHMLEDSELAVWWCRALDRLLSRPLGDSVRASIASIAHQAPERWGDVNQITYKNLIVGGLPAWFGFDRGPYALPGSIATVSQGSIVRSGDATVCVAPVYRFVTDLAEEAAWTSIPGGVDGSRFDATYTTWLDEHRAGLYHRIAPPALSEG